MIEHLEEYLIPETFTYKNKTYKRGEVYKISVNEALKIKALGYTLLKSPIYLEKYGDEELYNGYK